MVAAMYLLGSGLLWLALAGSAYTLVAAALIGRFRGCPPDPGPGGDSAISVLRPLHGAEPRLRENLETLLAQDHQGPVQLIFGVRDRADAAVAVVESLRRAHPEADITLVVDAHRHGANNKLSNVINMAARIRHPLVVLADSDVSAPRDTLRRLAAALAEPGVGIVSCLHSGRGDAGFWSVLGAMDISYRFMPSVALACATGLAEPCLGPIMALTRATLESVGGFAAFADVLADDHKLGRAVRARGLRSVVPHFTITHSCDEPTLAALVRHELRWTRTIYGISPLGFSGSGLTHCLPLALLGCAFTGFDGWGLAILAAAWVSRILLMRRIDRVVGGRTGPTWLLPVRDVLSFLVFLATFFVNDIDWRGSRYKVSCDEQLLSR